MVWCGVGYVDGHFALKGAYVSTACYLHCSFVKGFLFLVLMVVTACKLCFTDCCFSAVFTSTLSWSKMLSGSPSAPFPFRPFSLNTTSSKDSFRSIR